jgi:hypothetical protein
MPTDTIRKFKVELVPERTKARHLNLTSTIVDIELKVTTYKKLRPGKPDPVPDAAMARLEAAARKALVERSKYITAFITITDHEINKLLIKAGPRQELLREAEKKISIVEAKIKKACAAAEDAAKKGAEDRLKKEKNDDKNLSEARVATVFKWSMTTISVAVSLLRLVISAGVDASAYLSIVMAIKTLGDDERRGKAAK